MLALQKFAGRGAERKPIAARAADRRNCCAKRSELERRRRWGEEIEARYAPGLNDRFVRITRRRRQRCFIYPRAPRDQSFDPRQLPPPAWPADTEAAREVPLPGGRQMLLTRSRGRNARRRRVTWSKPGRRWTRCRLTCAKWLSLFLAVLPVVAVVALGGGFLSGETSALAGGQDCRQR